ncbi:HIT family protein [Streptomyces sp. JJ66]|uniref:HIT family protein n=1 Tax=Streptomyces sp. JJ66 TaxID=2803843 RepID=UPI001C597861|nr:HIT family protein [Streptomyces sp. JJ66]MBW1602008.1 HIT family protein [Streptomyces sp. JJ66]
MSCLFCRIVRGDEAAHHVYQDEHTTAFLDVRPLFPGHTLLVPRTHRETLTDLALEEVGPVFAAVQRVARAVQRAMDATGTFVAANNHVSQSVPHFHVHVVPRNPKDGLRGFFWPRRPYADDAEAADVAARIRAALTEPPS